MNCTLCASSAEIFYTGENGRYFICPRCRGIFLDPESFPSQTEEKERYLKHNNDINDPGYHSFVEPVVRAISKSFSPHHRGLDFGCGQDSVIAHLLNKEGFALDLYDPFFRDNKSVLSNRYDFIACCEVIEHFHHPDKEFKLLASLLKPGGRLYCMTDLYKGGTDFGKWYYKNDKTHVFFYHPDTIRFIKEDFGFEDFEIRNRLITLSR